MNRKLYRSVRDRKLCGLIGGLGEWLGFDVTLLRILFVIGCFFSGFTLLFVYFIVALVVPKEPYTPYGPQGYGSGPYNNQNGYNGGYTANDQGYYNNNNTRQGGSYDNYGGYNSSGYGNMKQKDNSSIDSMMEDIERKAMMKELQELRNRVAKYEKGDK